MRKRLTSCPNSWGSGCGLDARHSFFTLNPQDCHSPLTLLLVQEDTTVERRFSLDLSDEEAAAYVHEFLREDPRRLRALAAGNPLAATRCFHWTVRLVIRTLFNCDDKPGLSSDSIPAKAQSGVFGHVRAYFGVVEPQMRKALHLHMLIQLLGFSHPQDLLGTNIIPDTFRRLWYFVASISFRSTEAFATFTNEDAATNRLASLPLLPLTKKQRGMIGEARVRESFKAQMAARGITIMPESRKEPPQRLCFTSNMHGDNTLDASTWAANAIEEVAGSTARTGNHVCRPDVCHKGRIGRMGFCRMFYWHWARFADDKKRPHG